MRGNVAFSLVKYAVFGLLALDVALFFARERAAAAVQFPGGVPAGQLIAAFAASIDTLAWVLLLIAFEVENRLRPGSLAAARADGPLRLVRAACYACIVYAFYGYVASLRRVYATGPMVGAADPCALADGGWFFAMGLGEAIAITPDNCAGFAGFAGFERFTDQPIVVDPTGLAAMRRLAWLDAINAGAWLLVVLLLEIDVRLQRRGRYRGAALALSAAGKAVLYPVLLLAAVGWAAEGALVDAWDACLWLFAFAFIEEEVFMQARASPAPG